jgi:protein-L-isoaspartate(D-aspartate) O-methyltransferase
MLLVTRASEDAFTARFVCGAAFIPCIGARSEASAEKLTKAFAQGKLAEVRSLRRESAPDETCWVAGDGWWLSTA